MITAWGINKFYGDLQVLKNVDISIDEGEMVSIVGPSGAGKTTLLQILGTLDRLHSKKELYKKGIDKYPTIFINDIEINELNDNQLSKFRNKELGFVFQQNNLLPEFTALENVIIPALISKEDKNLATKKGKEILDFLGLIERIKHKPSELSGGEQQRVSVARALINEPKIIFADEPSGSLDSKNAEELHNLFITLKKEFKTTFVIVTHNKELANIADRKLEMKDGEIMNS